MVFVPTSAIEVNVCVSVKVDVLEGLSSGPLHPILMATMATIIASNELDCPGHKISINDCAQTMTMTL